MFKCDRCGRRIPIDQDITRSFTHRQTVRGCIFFDLFIGEGVYEFERDVDLCKECNESFIDWFNAGEGTKKMKKGAGK